LDDFFFPSKKISPSSGASLFYYRSWWPIG
jgi:hypothetical protein